MAQDIPPHVRLVFNPRELSATRAERLWMLHAELSTPHGLLRAALWLPIAWPHLLQLLADAHSEVRAAAAQLLGHLGAMLDGRREPSLCGRMPPSALLDWGLAMLSPTSTLPAALRMAVEAKEAALTALCVCVAAMPPSDVAPFAQPLLHLTMGLLEATTTPPRLLGPLLRLLLGSMPAIPLAALGQSFGDLVDLLCGWALEPLVAHNDRQLITLVLHALRPQWHSHPDLTASLTDNMLNDGKAAAASVAGAVTAATMATALAEDSAEAVSQAAACLQLVQLLCDIFSAASLRQLPLDNQVQPMQDYQEQISHPSNSSQLLSQSQVQVVRQRQHRRAGVDAGISSVVAAGPHSSQGNTYHGRKHQQQYPLQTQLSPAQEQQQQPSTSNAIQTPERLQRLAISTAPPLALTAVLRTRPGVALVRHLITLYPRLLAVLEEIRNGLADIGQISGGLELLKAGESWSWRLCGCIETLVDSVGSCVTGIDPRDIMEVWEGLGDELTLRLAVLTLQEKDQTSGIVAALHVGSEYGIVGVAAAEATQEGGLAPSGKDGRNAGQDEGDMFKSQQAAGVQDRSPALHAWVSRTALEWTLRQLSDCASADEPKRGAYQWPLVEGPGLDTDALMACAMRLLSRAAVQAGSGRGPLLELVLDGDEEKRIGVCVLRSVPRASSVSVAGKLLRALLSHEHRSIASATLDWILTDLQLHLEALQQGYAALPLSPLHKQQLPLLAVGDSAVGGADAAGVAAFDCAVLQASCQRGWVRDRDLLRVEGLLWSALQAFMTTQPPSFPDVAPELMPAQQLNSSAAQLESCDSPSDVQSGSGCQHTTASNERVAAASTQLRSTARKGHAPPVSVALVLCDAWAAAAVALIAAQHQTPGALQFLKADGCAGTGPPGVLSVTRSCCGAYLRAVHALLTGSAASGIGAAMGADLGSSLQLHAMMALQRLVKHPYVIWSGVLRCEQLFSTMVDVCTTGVSRWDARVRAAAANVAKLVISGVLSPKVGAAVMPPPRPDAFAPLLACALNNLSDCSPDAAAAAARLALELSEAGLLVLLRGPASYRALVPSWQDALADAPQARAPRAQQVARLLELVFQSAAAQGSVLLRKRTPLASGSGPGTGDDIEAISRMEALQRLAMSMLQTESSQQAADVGDGATGRSGLHGAIGGAAESAAILAALAEGRNGAALVWLALQEGAKQIVATRLRTHLGGPTQTLAALERMLQVIFSRLSQERRDAGSAGVSAASRESAWLVLELVGALERAVAHAAEGHVYRETLAQPVLAFFAANKKVCEEWFTRGRELLARIASLSSAHHHAAHHGLQRLRDVRGVMRQLLANLARERSKASAAPGPQADAKKNSAATDTEKPQAAVASASDVGSASVDAVGLPGPSSARHGSKQLHRRSGPTGEDVVPSQELQAKQSLAGATAGGAASGGNPTEEVTVLPSAVQQLESSLSRLGLTVVDVLKLIGAALLAMGEADSLQGLHTWAVREFDPLLQGGHLPGASAVAAAAAAKAADALAQGESVTGGAGLGTFKRRQEPTRLSRSGSGSKQQKDAFAWLLGLSLQASASYEQALLSYNAFLVPYQAPAGQAGTGSPGAGGTTLAPSLAVGLEFAAAAQGFVVERVAECYAALADWSGLQGLVSAFSRTAAVEPAATGWWPATAATIEYRFRALASYDSTARTALGALPDEAPRNTTSVLLTALRTLAMESTKEMSQSLNTSTPLGVPGVLRPSQASMRLHTPLQDLIAVRQATSSALCQLNERLLSSALSEPTEQVELFLQASCLRSALRALNGRDPVAHGGDDGVVHAPWDGLLLPQVLRATQPSAAVSAGGATSPGFGLGRAFLTADGGLQPAIIRDVAVTAALLRVARAVDTQVVLPATQALSVELIRSAATAGNAALATRLVQGMAARVDCGVGGRAVLSVMHSLVTAVSDRLPPVQVVELQLRALLPHLAPPDAAAVLSQPQGTSNLDSDDLACALCTLARWIPRAGGAAAQHHYLPSTVVHDPRQHHQSHPSRHQRPPSTDSELPGRHSQTQSQPGGPPGFSQHHLHCNARISLQLQHGQPPPSASLDTGGDVGRGSTGQSSAPSWMAAADWSDLSSHYLRQLVTQHAATNSGLGSASSPSAHLAFLVPDSLLQSCYAPAACCLRALQLSPSLGRAWKAWGDLLFKVTKEQRVRAPRPLQQGQRPGAGLTGSSSSEPGGSASTAVPVTSAASDDASSAWVAIGYGATAVAYCRYLSLSYSHAAVARLEDMLPVLLQLLHIIVRHAVPMEQLLESQLAAVPPLAWSAITPQLLAQLPGTSGPSRRLLGLLLHAVGLAAPSLVLYPAVVELRAADAAAAAAAAVASSGNSVDSAAAQSDESTARARSASMVPELRALLTDLGRSRPGLLSGVEVLVAEMERLTVLCDERWMALLAEVEVDIARRAVSLQAEAARVADDASLSADQRQALLSSRYSTLMAPAVMLLERQLRATGAVPPETPHEQRFAASMLPRLRAAAAALRDGTGVRDWARPSQAWSPLRAAAAALARQQRQPLPRMAELSPRLAALQGSGVPMPGCQSDDGAGGLLVPWASLGLSQAHICEKTAASSTAAAEEATVMVVSVCSELVALNTKTRPKRVALLGSDGKTYAYLLKGREDLRMDERLMQVLRAINSILQADNAAASRGLATVRCYSVTPLGPRAGLIQWVPATTSLFGIFRQWQASTLERHTAMVAARQEGVAKAGVEGTPLPPEVEPPPAAAVSRPMDLFYSTLVSALQERGLSSATPRHKWPVDLLRAVFTSLVTSSPRQLLARVLWAGGGSAALSWRRQQRYGRSLAVMSCVGYLLGLGDRHPDNILMEGREAGVVHIDYNVCWDKGSKLRVPEVVPFRLTRMLSTALGEGGLEGPFRAACEATFACLRRRREALVGLADAVLSDPGVDWAVEREDMAARQDMELAVALNLFVSRAEEAQRQLQTAEDDLPAVLEGPIAVLLAYCESHVFAEALRSAATEAQQHIQQAKAALEAASRAEAEARAIVTAAAQEAASLASEATTLANAVPPLLQQCVAWAQWHASTLSIVRDGSFLEGTLTNGASWRAVESGCALGLLAPVQGTGNASLTATAPLALLPAAMGTDGLGVRQLPEELLLSCHECDRQALDLLGRREAGLCEAVGALTQYGTIVRKLLQTSYPASSYHHRWAQAFAALAASGLALPAIAQVQALAPREPRPLDIAAAWQALRGAQRLATAAAIVLAPGSQDSMLALTGHVGNVPVPGRELAGAVAAAEKALYEPMGIVVAEMHVRAQEWQAAATAFNQGGLMSFSQEQLKLCIREQLKRLTPSPQRSSLSAVKGDASMDTPAATAATALLKLLQATNSRLHLQKAGVYQSDVSDMQPSAAEAVLLEYLRLSGEVVGLSAATSALGGTWLSTLMHGRVDLGPSGGSSPHSLSQQTLRQAQLHGSPSLISRSTTPGLHSEVAGASAAACPLPWLAAAADACGRWPDLLQRLAVDVAPELAGQLHVGFGGCTGAGGGGSTSAPQLNVMLSQAIVDVNSLLRTIEEALQAGRDAHARLEALTELTATYQDRRADLSRRLASGHDGTSSHGDVTSVELESLDSDLRALDAAWVSREAGAANLSATAAAATEALADAVRRFYAVVLGPNRLPADLQPYNAYAATASSSAGAEGWAETGSCGHAAVAALAAWWDAVTESWECVHIYIEAGTPLATCSPAGSCFEAPPAMRPLWRYVEAVYLTEQSLRACSQAVRFTAPSGTDGALGEAFGPVLQVLSRRLAEYATARLLPHLRYHLTNVEAKLTAFLEHGRLEQLSKVLGCSHEEGSEGVTYAELPNKGDKAGNHDETAAALGTVSPELVPFTDFDPRISGEGESLGGVDSDDEKDNGAAWLGYDEDEAEGVSRDADGGSYRNGYDFDLGLDLNLDDGFGGNGEASSSSSQAEDFAGDVGSDVAGCMRGVPRVKARPLVPTSLEEVITLLECLTAVAAANAVSNAAASVNPTPTPGQVPSTWAAGPEARALRAARLQRLASYEWMHEHHLLQAFPPGEPRVGQALAQFFMAQTADPLQPSARVTVASRFELLTQLQASLNSLPQMEQALSDWEATSGAAVSQAIALLCGVPERFSVDPHLAAQRAGMLMGRRQQWLAESRAVAMRVCQVAEALLQFEYSRQGIIWASGDAAMADGFATHCQLLGRAEVLTTLAAGGSEVARAATVAEASQRAVEAAMQAADARYALEVAQYEEVAASSQLQAHLPLLVSRSLELSSAVMEMEPVIKGLVQVLSSKLGPALKELSSVSAQHAAASDVASVATSVSSHFERSRQAAEALSAALPAILSAIAAADVSCPLPPDMESEVGFLSAQLLGGQAAMTTTRDRAMALLQQMTAPAAALQPVVHTVLELPRAVAQLNNELSTLAAAAGSIAAAVESKHLLPAMDEQQQHQQPQSQSLPQGQPGRQTPPQVPAASASPPNVAGSVAVTGAQADMKAAASLSPLEVSGSAAAGTSCGTSTMANTSATVLAAGTGTSTRTPLQFQVHAAAADHVQHHRSRRSAADEARRRAFAASALRRFVAKLEGREVEAVAGTAMAATAHYISVPDQVDILVRQATSTDRLAHMYEGWAAWL